jgi:hypothetical protein
VDGRAVAVDGERRVVAVTPAATFSASRFDDGEIVSRLAGDSASSAAAGASEVADPEGLASGALSWELEIPPGAFRDVVAAVPLSAASPPASSDDPARDFERRLAAAAEAWRERLGRVAFTLPPQAAPLARAARTNLGWILLDRDGSALQPGTRSYARAWIRDGALMAAALLRLGHSVEARDFLLWFAPFQFESGAVPCCVDRRGADPVAEHDSHGELIFVAAEYFDFTGDRATLDTVWPHVARAADHIDALRGERRTEEYRSGPRSAFFGLLPESISHEGYSDRPVHSYWDDFWALRGLADAARLARILGKTDEAQRFAGSSAQMQADVEASIRTVIAARSVDFIPGSADLADFDATSTTIALDPGGQAGRLPAKELARTFEKYWDRFAQRSAARTAEGSDYTPYEWRIVGSLVRLGQRDRAAELAAFLLGDRRPAEWNQWAEVVWPRPREPRFIGDMPHGWVAADFLRSFLDLFAWDRESDGALVLGAGIPVDWMQSPGGVAVSGLRTRYGSLDLRLSASSSSSEVRVRIAGTAAPPGGFAIPWPRVGAPSSATVNGQAVPAGAEIVVRALPADVVLRGNR